MASNNADTTKKVLLGVVLFPGFEPLDVAGPVNLFAASQAVDIIYIAQEAGPVTSVTGTAYMNTMNMTNALYCQRGTARIIS